MEVTNKCQLKPCQSSACLRPPPTPRCPLTGNFLSQMGLKTHGGGAPPLSLQLSGCRGGEDVFVGVWAARGRGGGRAFPGSPGLGAGLLPARSASPGLSVAPAATSSKKPEMWGLGSTLLALCKKKSEIWGCLHPLQAPAAGGGAGPGPSPGAGGSSARVAVPGLALCPLNSAPQPFFWERFSASGRRRPRGAARGRALGSRHPRVPPASPAGRFSWRGSRWWPAPSWRCSCPRPSP